MSEGYVCVGGPYDRKMVSMPSNSFRVFAERRMPLPRESYELSATCEIPAPRVHTYYMVVYQIGTVTIEFWRHQDLSEQDAIIKMISHYPKKRKHARTQSCPPQYFWTWGKLVRSAGRVFLKSTRLQGVHARPCIHKSVRAPRVTPHRWCAQFVKKISRPLRMGNMLAVQPV